MAFTGCWEKDEMKNMDEIRVTLEGVFRSVFSDTGALTDATSPGDISGWDSLNHIVLINAIEERFGIKFELEEILTMQRFGEICAGVEKKLSDQ
jgi:acyl carrier protein